MFSRPCIQSEPPGIFSQTPSDFVNFVNLPGRTSASRGYDSSICLQKTRATCFRTTDVRVTMRNDTKFFAYIYLIYLSSRCVLSALEIEASKNCMCAFTEVFYIERQSGYVDRVAVNTLSARVEISRKQNFS